MAHSSRSQRYVTIYPVSGEGLELPQLMEGNRRTGGHVKKKQNSIGQLHGNFFLRLLIHPYQTDSSLE